jgi:hypothetical protein
MSRDKSNTKSKSCIKSDDESKSVSYKTKKDTSNDFSFSELLSYDNDKKTKDEKEMKNLLKDQIKNEIKKEIEKEVKEELKSELINKIFLSTSNINLKTKIPNLKIQNNNIINNMPNDYGICNTNPNIDGKTLDSNTNRSISSIDIFFPPKKNISNNNNFKMPGIINYSNSNSNKNNIEDNNNIIMKKLVKLYNTNIFKKEGNKPLTMQNSFNDERNNNIYLKAPINNINNSFQCKEIYKNNTKVIKKKIIKMNNKIKEEIRNRNNNNINYKSISPIRKNKNNSFKKKIVKNNYNKSRNKNNILDKKIKIEKDSIINYIKNTDNNNTIINNKTNNILYIKQISQNRTVNIGNPKIYGKKKIYK